MYLRRIVIGALTLLGISCNRSDVASPKTLEKIRQLLIGLQVSHAPNPVRAVRYGASGLDYTWTYSTTVTSPDHTLTIVEFGAFVDQEGSWVLGNYTGKPFTRQDFSEWYSCPGGVVQPNTVALDLRNWSGQSRLEPSRMLWYFIGKDVDGKCYRGEAEIELAAELSDL